MSLVWERLFRKKKWSDSRNISDNGKGQGPKVKFHLERAVSEDTGTVNGELEGRPAFHSSNPDLSDHSNEDDSDQSTPVRHVVSGECVGRTRISSIGSLSPRNSTGPPRYQKNPQPPGKERKQNFRIRKFRLDLGRPHMPHQGVVGADKARKRSLSGNASGQPNSDPPSCNLIDHRYKSEEEILSHSPADKLRKSSGSSSGSSVRNSVSPADQKPSRLRSLFDNIGRPRSKSDTSAHNNQIQLVASTCTKPSSMEPLTINTNNSHSGGSPAPSPGLVTIPQGQELMSVCAGCGANASPGNVVGELLAAPTGGTKTKKRSKSPKRGLMGRIRSLSVSAASGDNTNLTPLKMPDPAKLPKEDARSVLIFTQHNLKSTRYRKMSQPNASEVIPKPVVTTSHSKSDETLLASLNISGGHSQIQRTLAGLPDPGTDAGTAFAAITSGVRRVSENKRFLIFSKSPLQTPEEFLEDGMERLGDNDSYAVFFQHSTCYDLMPDSSKLVVLDSQLQVGRAFRALVFNGLRSAPIWNTAKQSFSGMLTITDFIRILHNYKSREEVGTMESFEEKTIQNWRAVTHPLGPNLHFVSPENSLFNTLKILHRARVHRLPVLDSRSGNMLHIVTHKRLMRYLYMRRRDMPEPTFMRQTLEESGIGVFRDVFTVHPTTPLSKAFKIFVEKRVSALPVVADDGSNRLLDIYAKFDTIHLAATNTYMDLDITIAEALNHRKQQQQGSNGVWTCLKTDTLLSIMERIVTKEVHRLVVIDNAKAKKVIGVVSLSDLLVYMVLKQVPACPPLRRGSLSPTPIVMETEEDVFRMEFE